MHFSSPRHSATRIFSFLLCGALLLVLPACDSDSDGSDDGPAGSGTVSLNIEGQGIGASYEWSAFFSTGTDPESGEEAFGIYFTPDENPDGLDQTVSYAVFARRSGRAGPGNYDVASFSDDDGAFSRNFVFYGLDRVSGTTGNLYYSDSGSLTIASSSENRIQGSFNIDGSYFDVTNGERSDIQITGSFDAMNGAFFVPGGFGGS